MHYIEKPRKISFDDYSGIGGHFKIVTSDGQVGKCDNIIPNVGIQWLGDLLIGAETTLTELTHMETGTGTNTPAPGDTDIQTPTTGTNSGRRTITTRTRSVTTPYEVVLSYFIASGDLDRPVTITELAVYWEDQPTGSVFAHGLLDTPVTLTGSATATVSYGLVFL